MRSHFDYHPLPQIPESLSALKLQQLFYVGRPELLQSSLKIAIVGSRNPNPYARAFVTQLASKLTPHATIISGGALGIDIIAHKAALPHTIMISPSSLDLIYPASNQHIIKEIAARALILSEYEKNTPPRPYSFLQRNRIVIGLSDIVIIPQADLGSGSMQSAKMALKLKKPLYVLPHRINESLGTKSLLSQNQARPIYDIEEFLKECEITPNARDEILEFCAQTPDYEVALEKFGNRLLEYELDGKIRRENGKVIAL